MGLFERAAQLDALAGAIGRIVAVGGAASGAVVTIAGDAGAGKTSLISAALADAPAAARVLRAACDPLSTPRPLGPVRDVQAALGDPVTADTLLGVEARFAASISATPTVLVIDDAQWIDAASVEVLRFLARRIESLPVVLVLAHRDVPLGHVLLALLGDAARMESAVDVTVPPLSAGAVREILGDRDADADRVVALTGGNPFFVAEIARHPGEELPRTIRDAVASSTTGLAEVELDALQLMAAAPDAFDDRLLPYVGIDVPTLRRLEATGLLVRTSHGIAFRHELARLAIVASIEPASSRSCIAASSTPGSASGRAMTPCSPTMPWRPSTRSARSATRCGPPRTRRVPARTRRPSRS